MSASSIFVGKGADSNYLYLQSANRHGLIAGATGTGKTVSLQILAEAFSTNGVPVFMADVKGDLSGMCQPGEPKPKILERVQSLGMADYKNIGYPVVFWDLYGEQGHPVRGTVSDMGPLLLSRLLDLNATQEGVMNIAFKLADDKGLLLLDFKDLRAMLEYVGDNAKELKSAYGNVSTSSVGAIQRALLVLEQQGGEKFFGEPALQLSDLMRTTQDSRGMINILAADKLMQNPRLYATFLLWLLSELFEELPEVGDPDKPRLVFFFDEAHLLFDNAPDSLVQKVEQVVRLIRSKGIGVYFITQNPLDVPDTILGQLGNRIQHALRAFTPRDQKAVRAAAQTFRARDGLDTEEAITQLGVGEGLVSMLDEKGVPTPADRSMIRPPCSRIGPASPQERSAVIQSSPIGALYNNPVDRDSAYETLKKRADVATTEAVASKKQSPAYEPPQPKAKAEPKPRPSNRQGIIETFAKSAARSIASSLGRSIMRGILGSISKGR